MAFDQSLSNFGMTKELNRIAFFQGGPAQAKLEFCIFPVFYDRKLTRPQLTWPLKYLKLPSSEFKFFK